MPTNANQLLRQIIEIAPLAIVALDQQRRVTQWNAAAERIFGWQAAEAMGCPAPMLAEAQRDELNGLIEQGLAGETRAAIELRCLRKDGSPVDVRLWTAPLRGEAGESVGRVELFMDVTEQRRMQEALRESEARPSNALEASRLVGGVATDITELKRAESALDDSRKRLQALFDNIRDGILLVDKNARHVDANPALCELLGYSREEMLRMALWDDVPPHLQADLYGLWSKFLAVGRLEGEFTVQRKDGSTVEVEYRAVAHFMPDLHLCTVRDITARRRAEDELKDYATHLKSLSRRLVEVQESERKTLARELHDQTGQNLTAINLHLSMIREQFSSETESAIRARVEDSMALVASTVEAVRDVMSNLRPPVLEDYGLLAGLQWYGEIFSQRAGFPVCISGVEPSPRLAPVAETALFRIAQEALTNVVKHANASRVEVTLEGGAKRARLTIADNGRGFDVTGERRAGAGWGLLTMQERVEAVGGFLQVDSAPGSGTRIVVEVPPGE